MTRDDLHGMGYSVMAPSPATNPDHWTVGCPGRGQPTLVADSEDEAWAMAEAHEAQRGS